MTFFAGIMTRQEIIRAHNARLGCMTRVTLDAVIQMELVAEVQQTPLRGGDVLRRSRNRREHYRPRQQNQQDETQN